MSLGELERSSYGEDPVSGGRQAILSLAESREAVMLEFTATSVARPARETAAANRPYSPPAQAAAL